MGKQETQVQLAADSSYVNYPQSMRRTPLSASAVDNDQLTEPSYVPKDGSDHIKNGGMLFSDISCLEGYIGIRS